jgi:hypothetical protein
VVVGVRVRVSVEDTTNSLLREKQCVFIRWLGTSISLAPSKILQVTMQRGMPWAVIVST